MAENRLKIRICRLLGSCKSKDQISDDVVETHHSRQHYQLVELFSPQPRPFTFRPLTAAAAAEEHNYFVTAKINTPLKPGKLRFLSPDNVDGRKCPPASPIFTPLREKKKPIKRPQIKKKLRSIAHKKKHSGFAEFPECKYNGLFSSDEEEEEEEEADVRFSAATARRRMDAEAAAPVEDSLAVVKRSSDPYSDFRRSMVEMIVEKQIFAARDLENLLRCFLSLNSYHHHKVIIQVFAEIWEVLLP